jgi:hypothetical protein
VAGGYGTDPSCLSYDAGPALGADLIKQAYRGLLSDEQGVQGWDYHFFQVACYGLHPESAGHDQQYIRLINLLTMFSQGLPGQIVTGHRENSGSGDQLSLLGESLFHGLHFRLTASSGQGDACPASNDEDPIQILQLAVNIFFAFLFGDRSNHNSIPRTL